MKMFKKLIAAALMAAPVLAGMTACDNKEKGHADLSAIVGTWQVTNADVQFELTPELTELMGDEAAQLSQMMQNETAVPEGSTITLNADKTGTMSGEGSSQPFTYTYDGTNLVMTSTGDDDEMIPVLSFQVRNLTSGSAQLYSDMKPLMLQMMSSLDDEDVDVPAEMIEVIKAGVVRFDLILTLKK